MSRLLHQPLQTTAALSPSEARPARDGGTHRPQHKGGDNSPGCEPIWSKHRSLAGASTPGAPARQMAAGEAPLAAGVARGPILAVSQRQAGEPRRGAGIPLGTASGDKQPRAGVSATQGAKEVGWWDGSSTGLMAASGFGPRL